MSLLLLSLAAVAAQTPWGAPCETDSCSCAGFCLASQKGTVVDTPPDADGYAYKFSLCSSIPTQELPSGCQNYAEDATVVKYNVRLDPPELCAPAACALAAAAARGFGCQRRPASQRRAMCRAMCRAPAQRSDRLAARRVQISNADDCIQVGELNKMCGLRSPYPPRQPHLSSRHPCRAAR